MCTSNDYAAMIAVQQKAAQETQANKEAQSMQAYIETMQPAEAAAIAIKYDTDYQANCIIRTVKAEGKGLRSGAFAPEPKASSKAAMIEDFFEAHSWKYQKNPQAAVNKAVKLASSKNLEAHL
jgi:hypothetical protein